MKKPLKDERGELAKKPARLQARTLRYMQFILPPNNAPDVSAELKARAEAKRERKRLKHASKVSA